MHDVKIELKDGYNTLKAIYYRNGNGSIFTYQRTKWPIIAAAVFGICSIASYLVAFTYPETGWIVLFVLCSFITLVALIFLFFNARKYLNWKKPIDEYLQQVRKYESQWLTLTPNSIEISNADGATVEKWENIKYASFQPDYISLKSDNHGIYLFPEKSMEPSQFADLREFIRKIMNSDPSKIQEPVVV